LLIKIANKSSWAKAAPAYSIRKMADNYQMTETSQHPRTADKKAAEVFFFILFSKPKYFI